MTQYIYTTTDFNNAIINEILQRSQIAYHNRRVIEIFWNSNNQTTLVQNNGQYFYLSRMDDSYTTIRDIFNVLCINREQCVLTWTEEGNHCLENIIDTPIKDVVVNQISVYPANIPIPNNPHPMVLPMAEP